MTVLDKIKAFFKRLKPEAKGTEKKAVEPEKAKRLGVGQKSRKYGMFQC